MAERLTGWHPDPWAVHELRYFSISGTPTRLVKNGARTSYDAPPRIALGPNDLLHHTDSMASSTDTSQPFSANRIHDREAPLIPHTQPHRNGNGSRADTSTTVAVASSPTPLPNEIKREPKCSRAVSELLAHLIESAHRKLRVAEEENDPGRVTDLREQIELLERLVRPGAQGAESTRLDRAVNDGSREDPPAGQSNLSEGLRGTLDLRIARLPAVEPHELKGVATRTQPPRTKPTPTHPPSASKATLTMPSVAPNPPPVRARKDRKEFNSFRIITSAIALIVLPLSVLATIHDFERNIYYVTDVNHRVLTPQEIKVSWTVQNTGRHAGTPNCEVHASSPGNADAGSDTAPGIKSIPAGGQETAVTTLTIANDGAEHVTNVSVAC